MMMIHKSDDDRIILSKLTAPAEPNLPSVYILNLYAPAEETIYNKTTFYNKLIDFVKSLEFYSNILDRLILAGKFDFQYDLHLPGNLSQKQPTEFVFFTNNCLHDCNSNYSNPFFEMLPIFRRGQVIKTLDYIMMGHHLKDL
ncbi:hypothetical protein INT46_003212 [Mucor plumbeus]|uniref:Uncharacterized protein n=1 Tax=Mucor plumbeus TaxID=97098 RepID=A0A8H7QTC5_9FUNG|nr:hypothetical protein INT46_003212 [Mucor plumbeus]